MSMESAYIKFAPADKSFLPGFEIIRRPGTGHGKHHGNNHKIHVWKKGPVIGNAPIMEDFEVFEKLHQEGNYGIPQVPVYGSTRMPNYYFLGGGEVKYKHPQTSLPYPYYP